MPRVIALGKVTKKLKSKKGSLKSLGERDTKRLNSAALRDAKLKQCAGVRYKGRHSELTRVGYFKIAIKDTSVPLEVDQMRELIENWIHRDDGELTQIQRERRPGRPPLPKEIALKQKMAQEEAEFDTGYRVPDLLNQETVNAIKSWDGSVGALSQISFIRIMRKDKSTPSQMEL